jgi:membrane-associated phospholipid phosphatase
VARGSIPAGSPLARRCFVPSSAGLALACLWIVGCGATRHGEPWGARASITPGFGRTLDAARDALLDPWVWVPLAGATVIWAADVDSEISHWARSETPVFGSTRGAEDGSHDWRAWSQDLWIASACLTPSGDGAWPWLWNKSKGLGVQFAAKAASGELTSLGKDAFGRERPDHSDRRSMPSGHTTSAFASVTLARRNVDALRLAPAARVSLEAGLGGVGALAAWSRVEAGAHYPTDVLVGAALGTFVARFVDDLFLDATGGPSVSALLDSEQGRWSVGLAWSL